MTDRALSIRREVACRGYTLGIRSAAPGQDIEQPDGAWDDDPLRQTFTPPNHSSMNIKVHLFTADVVITASDAGRGRLTGYLQRC